MLVSLLFKIISNIHLHYQHTAPLPDWPAGGATAPHYRRVVSVVLHTGWCWGGQLNLLIILEWVDGCCTNKPFYLHLLIRWRFDTVDEVFKVKLQQHALNQCFTNHLASEWHHLQLDLWPRPQLTRDLRREQHDPLPEYKMFNKYSVNRLFDFECRTCTCSYCVCNWVKHQNTSSSSSAACSRWDRHLVHEFNCTMKQQAAAIWREKHAQLQNL